MMRPLTPGLAIDIVPNHPHHRRSAVNARGGPNVRTALAPPALVARPNESVLIAALQIATIVIPRIS